MLTNATQMKRKINCSLNEKKFNETFVCTAVLHVDMRFEWRNEKLFKIKNFLT